MTSCHDCLLDEVNVIYFHQQKTGKGPTTKVACFLEPIVAVKKVTVNDNVKAYTIVHTSFQLTSSMNIIGVKNINGCSLSVCKKEKEHGNHKQSWGIKMSESRDLYLKGYHGVYVINHMIKLVSHFLYFVEVLVYGNKPRLCMGICSSVQHVLGIR